MLTAIRNFEFNPDDSNAARIFQENRDLLQEPEEHPQPPGDWAASESDVSQEKRVLWKAATLLKTSRRQLTQWLDQNLCTETPWLFMSNVTTRPCGVAVSCRQNYRQWQEGDPDLAQLLVCQQCDKAQP